MKKYLCLSVLLSLFTLLSSCSPADPDAELAAFKQAIRAKYDLKEQAFADNDPMPIVDRFYTEDAISTGPDTYVRGREELIEQYNHVIASTVRIESVHTHVNGDAGWDWANFYVTPPDPEAEPFALVLLFLWEKRDGEWWSPGEMYMVGELK